MKKRNPFHKRFLSAKQRLEDWKIGRLGETLPSFHPAFLILLFDVCLSGCMMPSVDGIQQSVATAEFTFEQHDVVIGTAKHQTVLTGFLLGGDLAELAVVSINENNDRHLRIYAFGDGTWTPRRDATLRPEVLFVDVANIGGHDRLLTYEHGKLNWFDLESATEHLLVAVTANTPPPNGGIPHVDITHDVNGDGRDDLVVPDIDGFWVFVQMSDGAFADPVKLGPPTQIDRLYGAGGYRYNPWGQSRIHEVDYNRDGRTDLVFWNEDHFEVHYQDERGLFFPEAETFTTDVAFDSDDLASLAAPHGIRRRRFDHNPTGALTGRVLHSLTDLNGDGVPDLAVFSLEGGSLWRMHSTYEVHFGTPTPEGSTMFAPDVSTAIQSDGIPFGMEQHDFDPDGQVDMMFTTLKPGIFKIISMIIGGLLTRSGSRDLKFYCMEGDTYPDKPNATRKIKTHHPGKSGEKAALFPSLLIGDVTGDGRSDLLLQNGRKELHVFVGVPGPERFARRPQKVAVAMPNEEYTWLVDLNKDGKQDVLMHHLSTIDKQDVLMQHLSTTEPHRVTILISR